jgi:hypothetical protein
MKMAKAKPTLSSISLLPPVEYPPPTTLEQELAAALGPEVAAEVLDGTAEIRAAPRKAKPGNRTTFGAGGTSIAITSR